jgi:MFS transporter, DHA1 family, multidrug resistance protein
MSRSFIIAFCGLLLAVSALSNDILLPAFWAIEVELATSIERVQAVVPAYLIASGIGQAVFGVASDRFGRRPVIQVGLVLFLAGSLVGMLASSIEVLLAGRAIQGLGGACGVVVARAVLRDCYSGEDLARAMALAVGVFTLGPLVAPLLGVTLIQLGGWRATFAGIVLGGAGLLAASVLRLRETNAAPDLNAMQPARLAASFARVMRHPQSRFFLAIAAIMQCSIISLIANSPRLYKSGFGIDGATYAMLFALTTTGIAAGQIANNRLIPRLGTQGATRLAACMTAGASALMIALAGTPALTAGLFTSLIFLFTTSFLVIMANASSLILEPHRDIAGFVSSLYGCLTQLAGSLFAILTFPIFRGEIAPWAAGQFAVTGAVLLALLMYRPDPLDRKL